MCIRDSEYTVPYTWGVVGLIYNTTMVDGTIDSWDALWDEKYENNVLMFSNSRDAFAIALSRLGYSLNTTDESQLEEAAEELKKQKSLGTVYVMDEIFDKMEGGEAAVAPYYAGAVSYTHLILWVILLPPAIGRMSRKMGYI